MTETCRFPLCSRHPEHDGYCASHKIYSDVKVEKPKYVIPKRSEKLKGEMKEYKKEVVEFLLKNKLCKIKSPVCTKIAVTVHHTKRRGKNLRNQRDWLPCCIACNGHLEENDFEARQNGHLKSKYQ